MHRMAGGKGLQRTPGKRRAVHMRLNAEPVRPLLRKQMLHEVRQNGRRHGCNQNMGARIALPGGPASGIEPPDRSCSAKKMLVGSPGESLSYLLRGGGTMAGENLAVSLSARVGRTVTGMSLHLLKRLLIQICIPGAVVPAAALGLRESGNRAGGLAFEAVATGAVALRPITEETLWIT